MDRSPQSAFGARKGIHPRARPAKRGAPRAALGQGRQDLRVRRPKRQADAGRSVRGPQPAGGAAFHVRARLERRLQELLVLGRRFRTHDPHLAARDTTLVAISRAPLQKLDAFKARMGWTFDWLSSADNDFNYDYAASFTPA